MNGYVNPIEIFKCGRCFKLIDMENSKGGFARMYPCHNCEQELKSELAKTQEALREGIDGLKCFCECYRHQVKIGNLTCHACKTLAKIKETLGETE